MAQKWPWKSKNPKIIYSLAPTWNMIHFFDDRILWRQFMICNNFQVVWNFFHEFEVHGAVPTYVCRNFQISHIILNRLRSTYIFGPKNRNSDGYHPQYPTIKSFKHQAVTDMWPLLEVTFYNFFAHFGNFKLRWKQLPLGMLQEYISRL